LQVFGELVADVEYDFDVRASEETHLDVEVRPGIAVSLSFPGAGESPPPAELRVILKDLAGHDVRNDRVSALRGGPPALEVSLAFGRYRVEAVAETGQRAEGSFEITRATPAYSEFTFPLR
jgi:hypothetical protein